MIRIHENYSRSVNAITHPSPHHADEVFATAMLAILFPVELFRTREQDIIAGSEAIVYDVGGVFDAKKKRFDHHQKGFSEARPDGTIYSSAGLIWREYGVDIVKKVGGSKVADDEMAVAIVSSVDEALIKGIDASDNGQCEDGDLMPVSSAIALFNPLWGEDENCDEGFMKSCELAGEILTREIKVATSSIHGRKVIEAQIDGLNDGDSVLVLDKFIGGWPEVVLSSSSPKVTGLLYAVFPALNGDWNIQAIPPDTKHMMEQKKPFPEKWRGLRGQDLKDATGVESAVFCHAAGFFAVAGTKADAIDLARMAAAS